MTRRRWVDLNSRFNCLNPRYNVGTPFFAPVDDYADENPKGRGAPVAHARHEAGDRDPAEAHARLQRDARAEQQAEYHGQKGVAEQSLERFCHMWPRPLPQSCSVRARRRKCCTNACAVAKNVCGPAQARRRQPAPTNAICKSCSFNISRFIPRSVMRLVERPCA